MQNGLPASQISYESREATFAAAVAWAADELVELGKVRAPLQWKCLNGLMAPICNNLRQIIK